MSALDLIARLQAQDIELYLDQDKLKVNAPKGALTPPLLAEIKADKDAIVALLREAKAAERTLIPPRDPAVPAVTSFAQQRLWFLDQLDGANPAYNMPAALRLNGTLDLVALRWGVQSIVDRHEILRTTFSEVDGVPRQVIAAAMELQVERIETTEQALATRVRDHALHRFDLQRGPLLRVTLLRLAEREHVLLVNMHHIVSDGWSMGIFVSEFAAAYSAAVSGSRTRLPPLPLQYADFCAWQRQWLQGAERERQLAHWIHQLADLPPLLALPTDRPRPPVQTHAGATVPIRWSVSLSQAVREFGRLRGASVYMTLLAALQVLLSRYSGQSDVAVGSPVANRARPELEGMIGFFVNTLVMRANCPSELPFERLLEQVRTFTLAAYEHQDLPLEQLVDELKPARSLSYAPLFQVMFALQNASVGTLELPGLELGPMPIENRVAKFDLNFNLEESDGRIVGGIEYNTDLFDRATVERMGDAYACLVEAIVARPHTPVGELPLMPPAQIAVIPDRHDQVPTTASPACLHRLFERQVRLVPQATALVADGQSRSYAELDRRANRLAHHLVGAGVGLDQRVAICLDRSSDLVIALLAVLKAGGAYVPLDPQSPLERFFKVLGDAAPVLLLTDSNVDERLRGDALRTIMLDRDARNWADLSSEAPAVACTPSQLAYVIYTSGSSGVPKGVMVTHANACAMLHGFAETAPALAPGQCTVVTPFGFDVSVWELFNALCHGEAAHVIPRDWLLEPDRLAAYWLDRRITTAYLPPALLEPMAAALEGREGRPALQRLLVGVEPIDARLLDRYLALCPGLVIVNGYGPTEATVCATFHRHQSGRADPGPVPIGRAVPGYAVYLLDDRRQPVPVGVVGELFIGGAGVARGYLADPRKSAEAFVPDPFSAQPGARCYRTGDLARRRVDGSLVFVGRRDAQVKIRGFRVELVEIDLALRALEEVVAGVTVAHKDANGNARLVAYVVAASGATATQSRLLDQLRGRLPDYMLPTTFVFIDRMPVTAHGKVDRRALPAPAEEAVMASHVAPRTALEEQLAGVWAEVLQRTRIGVNDSFFDMGGHSLLAIQVVSRIRAQLELAVDVRDLFEASTVAQLAERLQVLAPTDRRPPLVRVDRQQVLPLSFAQQRLWFLQALEGPSATYNMPVALRFRGALDVALMRSSLQELVRRQEILRTRFVERRGEPRLDIAEALELPLPVTDVRESEVEALARAHAGHVFDLATGPLLRVDLLRLDDCEHVLLLNIHHIISDGWSMGVLVHEWVRLYDAARQGGNAHLPALPVQYADYAHWQRNYMQEEVLQGHLRYWTTQLTGAPELIQLPTDRPRPPVQQFEGASETLELPLELSHRVQQLGREAGASVFMTLISAFALLMSRHSGEHDVLIGTPSANRDREELEGLVGIFLDSLVLRVDLSGRPSFRELLARVKRTALDAYAHAALPFERIVEALPLQRDLSRNPLFQVFFNMLNLPEGSNDLDGLQVEGLETLHFDSKFDLTLYAQERPSGLALNLVYNRGLFDPERMADLLRQYAGLLDQITATPEASIDAHRLATAQAGRVLPDPAMPLSNQWHGAVHERLAQQARQDPDAWAVVSHERRWSYRDLDAHSERIACYLQAAGVGRGDPVAICASRDATLVAAVMGVLKAGAVFMILDPAYPVEHLRACLEVAPARAWLQVAALDARDERATLAAGSAIRLDLRDIDGTPELERFDGERCTRVPLHPEDLALIAFTSGSSGRPKAVDGRHGSLTHFMPWLQARFGIASTDRFSMVSGLAHDPLQRDMFTALWFGACVHVPAPDVLTPGALARWMAQQGISVTNLTPAMIQLLTDRSDAIELPDLRLAFVVGDVLTRRDVRCLQMRAPAARVINFYGATETQRALSYHDVDRETPAQALRETIPLGRGNEGMQLLVLNTAGGLAGIGEHGEIHLRSPHLARGYRNDPAATAQAFVPNPFAGTAGERLYRTGDLGRYLPDGSVEGLGRGDTQVKLRGFRIELGHVESLLAQHPQICEASVAIQPVGSGERVLVAYVVGDPAPAADALREYLRSRVPDYMQPARYMVLPALPLTPNGKVDRRALPPVDLDPGMGQQAAPRDEVEARLAAVWKDVLQRERIGVHDNFFDMGGHSLLAMQLMVRIREELGVALPLRRIFALPTIADMAREMHGESSPWSPLVPLQDGSPTRLPLFVVHPLAGNILSYAELARGLGDDQPVYALQSQGLETDQRPLEDINTMAALYLSAIRQVQPHGPYWLCGYSLGGSIAVEMARQLREAGAEVAFLGLLDAYPSGRREPPGQVALMAGLWGGELQFDEADLDPLDEVQRIDFVLERARRSGSVSLEYRPEDALRQLRVIEANARASAAHNPAPYPGAVTLFQAMDNAIPVTPDDWQPHVAGTVDLIGVPGDHTSMIAAPHVQALAAALRARLDAMPRRDSPVWREATSCGQPV